MKRALELDILGSRPAPAPLDFGLWAPRPPAAPGDTFNGSDYEPTRDKAQLTGQVQRVFTAMQDGRWRSLPEIEAVTHDPPASISAQLRHLRKVRFGAHTIEKRNRGGGLFEYRLVVK